MTDRSPPSDDLRKPLTNVQWEIVDRINRGETHAVIAEGMGYSSTASVRWHVQQIAGRLPHELTADLEPHTAIIVWRRWLDWKAKLPQLPPRKSA